MERQISFAEQPRPLEWGDKRIVPLNVTEETTVDNGIEKKSYRADLVPKVKMPLTVESIVDAAIASEFGEEAQKRIMRNMASDNNPEVEAYKSFVNEIRTAAIAAGYE